MGTAVVSWGENAVLSNPSRGVLLILCAVETGKYAQVQNDC